FDFDDRHAQVRLRDRCRAGVGLSVTTQDREPDTALGGNLGEPNGALGRVVVDDDLVVHIRLHADAVYVHVVEARASYVSPGHRELRILSYVAGPRTGPDARGYGHDAASSQKFEDFLVNLVDEVVQVNHHTDLLVNAKGGDVQGIEHFLNDLQQLIIAEIKVGLADDATVNVVNEHLLHRSAAVDVELAPSRDGRLNSHGRGVFILGQHLHGVGGPVGELLRFLVQNAAHRVHMGRVDVATREADLPVGSGTVGVEYVR